jgi:hypothetical protein
MHTLVDFTEDDYTWESGFGVAWDCGMEDIDACVLLDERLEREWLRLRTHCPLAICCGGYIVVGFCDEHFVLMMSNYWSN